MRESIVELREICVKKGIGFRSRMLSYITVYITRILLPLSITPNQISVFWIILKFIVLLMLIPGKYNYALFGMIILQVAILLDNLDGQIARYKKMRSKSGWYLDFISHAVIDPLTFIFLGIGIYNAFGQIEYVFLGFSTALISLMRESIYTNEVFIVINAVRKNKNKKPSAPETKLTKIQRIFKGWFELGECVNILFFGIVLYLWREVLLFYFIIIALNFVLKLSSNFLAFRKYDQKFVWKGRYRK